MGQGARSGHAGGSLDTRSTGVHVRPTRNAAASLATPHGAAPAAWPPAPRPRCPPGHGAKTSRREGARRPRTWPYAPAPSCTRFPSAPRQKRMSSLCTAHSRSSFSARAEWPPRLRAALAAISSASVSPPSLWRVWGGGVGWGWGGGEFEGCRGREEKARAWAWTCTWRGAGGFPAGVARARPPASQPTRRSLHNPANPAPTHQRVQALERLPAPLLAPAQHQHRGQRGAGGHQADARHHQPDLQARQAAAALRLVRRPAGLVGGAVGAHLRARKGAGRAGARRVSAGWGRGAQSEAGRQGLLGGQSERISSWARARAGSAGVTGRVQGECRVGQGGKTAVLAAARRGGRGRRRGCSGAGGRRRGAARSSPARRTCTGSWQLWPWSDKQVTYCPVYGSARHMAELPGASTLRRRAAGGGRGVGARRWGVACLRGRCLLERARASVLHRHRREAGRARQGSQAGAQGGRDALTGSAARAARPAGAARGR